MGTCSLELREAQRETWREVPVSVGKKPTCQHSTIRSEHVSAGSEATRLWCFVPAAPGISYTRFESWTLLCSLEQWRTAPNVQVRM